MSSVHKTVLLQESIDYLEVESGKWYVDATLGSGGHAREILNRGGNVIGIDVDESSINNVKLSLEKDYRNSNRWKLVLGNFGSLDSLLSKFNLNNIRGFIYDLGFSSDQIADKSYGLSFQVDAPLDMRLDRSLKVTAKDLINGLSQRELALLFDIYGDESRSKLIAKKIVEYRKSEMINTTLDLAQIVKSVYGLKGRNRINPATRVFQALRMAVNDEINNLKSSLFQAGNILQFGGRIVVISFHSGEDRVVKRFISGTDYLKSLSSKPIMASEDEIDINPRARSAKMRIAEKI